MKRLAVFALLLGFWLSLIESPEVSDLLLGALACSVILRLGGPKGPRRLHDVRLIPLLVLAWTFWRELILSTVRVAYDILTPTLHARPAVLAVPLDIATDVQLTLFANLISLTPGNLALQLSKDHRALYVHFMYVDPADLDASRRELKRLFERRVANALPARPD